MPGGSQGIHGRGPVALLTGGQDTSYALGLAASLLDREVPLEVVGSDDLESADLWGHPLVKFLNLRGSQDPDAPFLRKLVRVCGYYARLTAYAATARPGVFHILWNNKFETFDRTVLMAFYRLLGKRIVLTVHNVNAAARDGKDGVLNRATLRTQYALADHLFVHTDQMRQALIDDFKVDAAKVTVIPFGLNTVVPATDLTPADARRRLGLGPDHKVLLFFGNIAPYKGVEYLVRAMSRVVQAFPECRLVIAGRPKGPASYWPEIEQEIRDLGLQDKTVLRIGFVPDADVEVCFKAADACVLPYRHIFQTGVLFLAYGFGLPVIASDVGAVREDVIEGETGFVCRPLDSEALATAIAGYFASSLFARLADARNHIRELAERRHSWDGIAGTVASVYSALPAGR